MKTVYLIVTHSDQSSDFDVLFASADYAKFEEFCRDCEFELDEDIFKVRNEQDFGYHDCTRYVAYAFNVKDANKPLFALCVNGYERCCWEGVVMGLYDSKDKVRAKILEELTRTFDVVEEELEETLSFFDKHNSCSDYDYTDWICLNVNVE